jgi:hypothetical protein
MPSKVYSTCPGPFVIPDDPDNIKVKWVEGTNCAYPCRNAVYSSREYELFERTADVTSIIGLAFVSILIISWSLDKKHRKKALILILAYLSAITSAGFLLTSNQSYESRFCSSNAVPIDSSDGLTTCAAQSFLLFYAGLAACYAWCAIAVALFLKVVMNTKILQASSKLRIVYASIVFGLPMMPALYIFSTDSYGYGGNLPWCLLSVRHSTGVDLYLYIIPVVLIILIGIICQTIVIFVILRTRSRISSRTAATATQSQPSNNSSYLSCCHISPDKFNSLKTPILFIICFLLVWVTTFTYRMAVMYYEPDLRESFNNWKTCLFDDQSAGDWESRCGYHPRFRMSVAFTTLCIFLTCGQSIFLFITFITIPSLIASKSNRRKIQELEIAKQAAIMKANKSGNNTLRSNKIGNALNGIRKSKIFDLSGSNLFKNRPRVTPEASGRIDIAGKRESKLDVLREHIHQQTMPAPRLVELSAKYDQVQPFSVQPENYQSIEQDRQSNHEEAPSSSKGKYRFPAYIPGILAKFKSSAHERGSGQDENHGYENDNAHIFDSQRDDTAKKQSKHDVLEDGLEIFYIQNMFAGQYSPHDEEDYGQYHDKNSLHADSLQQRNEEQSPLRDKDENKNKKPAFLHMISRMKFLAPHHRDRGDDHASSALPDNNNPV